MPKSIVGNQKGFTLIEIMLTMVVLVLVILGYVSTTTVIQRAHEGAYERAVAMQDAHRVIEQMRNSAVSGQFPNNVVAAFPNGGAVAGFNNLTNQQVVVTYANAAANPLDVTVTVNWNQNGVRPMNTSVRTLLTQRAAG